MLFCFSWIWSPSDRPRFRDIHASLESLFPHSNIDEEVDRQLEKSRLTSQRRSRRSDVVPVSAVRFQDTNNRRSFSGAGAQRASSEVFPPPPVRSSHHESSLQEPSQPSVIVSVSSKCSLLSEARLFSFHPSAIRPLISYDPRRDICRFLPLRSRRNRNC
ncbi:hypothetical protein ANCDUO_07353 [Ancylostoma duodenale]|uniref:Uncharacterized protein n=1 Tax=Ancylostoma duodenale TaxID=51022 RepID=A0A0C2DIR0_9BILA|nr:hypothetical protein ANCDUO_07353 [Ancylostoma duodenale]